MPTTPAPRFPWTEVHFTCEVCGQHLIAKSFPTVKDPHVEIGKRDRTGECRVCEELRRGSPVIHKRTPCTCPEGRKRWAR